MDAIDAKSQTGMLGTIAASLGASEPSLRLLVSILLGYPLAAFHRYTIYGKWPTLQHLLFIFTGITIGYFNFGADVVHSIICVLVLYLTLKFFGGTRTSLVISFIFHMTYLLLGYYYTGTDSYDIKWSMPHCVLTLRLIGLTFDVYDGRKKPEKLSADQKKTALQRTPSLLEIGGHTFFLGGFMVGPQFSMTRYQEFINGAFCQGKKIPDSLIPGLKRAALGLVYVIIYQLGCYFVPDSYIMSDSFFASSFLTRVFMLALWAKICLYKYISCWLFSEGVCTVAGLTYNGIDENGNVLWNGCANVKIRIYENAIRFGHYIQSFNINTNAWVAQYVYKRLRFLGNRLVSQFLTLLFLAVWHGLHIGYYVCFFMEFIVMFFEKDMETLRDRNAFFNYVFTNPSLAPLRWIVGKTYLFIFTGYCIAPFVLLSTPKIWRVYSSVHFMGFWFFLGWMALSPFIMPLLVTRRPKPSAGEEKKE